MNATLPLLYAVTLNGLNSLVEPARIAAEVWYCEALERNWDPARKSFARYWRSIVWSQSMTASGRILPVGHTAMLPGNQFKVKRSSTTNIDGANGKIFRSILYLFVWTGDIGNTCART